jgi:hypothetical protein
MRRQRVRRARLETAAVHEAVGVWVVRILVLEMMGKIVSASVSESTAGDPPSDVPGQSQDNVACRRVV